MSGARERERETTRLILVPERIEENGMGFEGGSLILGIQS